MKKKTKKRLKLTATVLLISYIYFMLVWNSGATLSELIDIQMRPDGTYVASESGIMFWTLMLIATSISYFLMLKFVNELDIDELRKKVEKKRGKK